MNKLVIIGNGFDLAHGLKTSYRDFLTWYLKKVVKLHLPKCYYKDNLLEMTNKYTVRLNEISSIQEFLMIQKEKEGINVKYENKFFENIINSHADNLWVDIEYKYYSHLLIYFKYLEQSQLDNSQAISKELKKLNTCFENIQRELIEYLSSLDQGNIKINEDIQSHFILYLKNAKNNSQSKTYFLVFNYTSTVEKYLELFEPNTYILNYIHGNLNDKKNPIIFGYGDEMDVFYEKIERLNTNEFLKYIKSFSYFKTNNYQDFSTFIDSAKFSVFIMGHSCGLSDRILLNSIFEHKNCINTRIFFYKINDHENDYFVKTQEISRHFKPENKGLMRRRIIPFPECKPLTN